MFFDVHLMVTEPERYIQDFVDCGADSITVHAEACEDLERTIELIRDAGVKVGVSIKPATPVNDISHLLEDVDMVLVMTVQPGFGGQKYMDECTEKIVELRELIDREDLDVDIQVDGGINDETMETVMKAGANIFWLLVPMYLVVIWQQMFTVYRKRWTRLNQRLIEEEHERCIIVSGGNIQRDFALDFLKKNKTEKVDLIAADRGVEFFKGTDWQPEVAVGDFDSLSAEGALYLQGLRETEIMRLKPEKDDSDTQSAVNFAIDRGAERITILGATGNRIDHLMANFGLLVHGRNRGADIILVDQWNYMKLIESHTVLKKEEQFGKYVSFFSLEGDLTGLTLRGFKYPLNKYHLKVSDSGLTVSNEIVDEEACVEFDAGSLLMLMTRD